MDSIRCSVFLVQSCTLFELLTQFIHKMTFSQLHLDIQIGGKKTREKFLVVGDAPSSLLSGKTCEDLEVLTVKRELLVNTISDVKTFP